MHYTGLPNKEIFNIIFSNCDKVLDKYYEEWNVTCLDRKDQLLVTLMKLKLNPTHTDLGVRFQVSEGTITNVFLTWLYCLHEVLYNCLMAIVPTQVKNELCLPSCFMNFRNCRMVIDCTDFCVQRPKKMSHQRLFYSSYKHRHTMKALIGVAPNGVITYTSEMYPGSTSDKELFKNCNVNNVFQPGDLVVADKGFLISDVVPDGVAVNIPPFLSASQFTPIQINSTKKIARARIHVERAIRRIKVFKITKMLPKSLFPHSSKILQVCVALTNFQPPLLKEVQHLYNIKP
nr:uncharacterized protein LOC107444196 [Parasteatoda tepidariorum]